MKRFFLWLFLFAAIGLVGIVALQQPWRPQGAIHIVKEATFAGVPIKIIQEHDGHGLNDTYLVAQSSNKWKWFGVSYDDPLWLTMKITQLPNGDLQLSKFGSKGPIFSPRTFTLTRGGQTDWLIKETTDIPQ